MNHSGSGSADSVVLLDRHRLAIDAVDYPPQRTSEKGRSLERIDLYAGVGNHVWLLSSDPRGASPGERNARSLLSPVPRGSLEVTHNPFSPYEGESVLVSVDPGTEGVRVVLTVFDIGGRKVSELGSATVFPAVFVWTGYDSSGRLVLPGHYVVACEYFSVGGGRFKTDRVVVGCARHR